MSFSPFRLGWDITKSQLNKYIANLKKTKKLSESKAKMFILVITTSNFFRGF